MAPLAVVSVVKAELNSLTQGTAMSPDEFEFIQSARRATFRSDDLKEGVKAFFDKDRPSFADGDRDRGRERCTPRRLPRGLGTSAPTECIRRLARRSNTYMIAKELKILDDFPPVEYDVEGWLWPTCMVCHSKKLIDSTYDGIRIDPIYTSESWPSANDASGFPGSLPYTRGDSTAGK